MAKNTNTKLLISAVEERPVLWDKSIKRRKNKNSKGKAWEEVCTIMNSDFQEMDEKARSAYVSLIKKKWKNTRDAWTRNLKRPNVARKFVYGEQLHFLQIKSEATNDKECNEDPGNTSSDSSHIHTNSPVKVKALDVSINEKGNKSDPKEKTTVPQEQCQVSPEHSRKPSRDVVEPLPAKDGRHMSFFKGIIPSLDPLEEEGILEFQAGVISLIQSIRKRSALLLEPTPTVTPKKSRH